MADAKAKYYSYGRIIEITGTSAGFIARLRSEIRREIGEPKYAKPRLGFNDIVQIIVARDIADAGIPISIAALALVASRGLTSKVTIPFKHDSGRPLAGLTIDYPAAIATAHRLLIEHGEEEAATPAALPRGEAALDELAAQAQELKMGY